MMYAKDISEDEARSLTASMKGSLQSFEVFPGVRLQGAYDPEGIWNMLAIDQACAGKRVLEIGPAQGYFTKRLTEAGADVTAMDYRTKEESGFWLMERLSGHDFKYVQGNVLDEAMMSSLGVFDIVILMGVLYHLPDPFKALDNCRSACRGTLILETLCDAELPPNVPAARYFASNSKGGDWTNFWAPNRACLEGMLLDTGFAVSRFNAWGDRILMVGDVIDHVHGRLKADIVYSYRR
jgi:tRNA (mo5U34)-methyltransferase